MTVAGDRRWGIVHGQRVRELPEGPFGESPPVGRDLGRLEDFEVLVPVSPSKIVCVGRNYVAHAAEHAADVPTEPALFLKPPSTVVAAGEPVLLPPQSRQVEHEGELALVIGRRGRRIDPARAWRHVLGVTCANDVTARDLQRSDLQWTRGKGFDTFCPVGPWVVTGVEEHALRKRRIVCRVNGETRQQGLLGDMVFQPSELVAYVSSVMTLEPGDLILTGTPAGVGPLVDGDLVEVEIEGVGILANPVREESGVHGE